METTVTCAATTDELTLRLREYNIVDGSLTVRCDSVDNSPRGVMFTAVFKATY